MSFLWRREAPGPVCSEAALKDKSAWFLVSQDVMSSADRWLLATGGTLVPVQIIFHVEQMKKTLVLLEVLLDQMRFSADYNPGSVCSSRFLAAHHMKILKNATAPEGKTFSSFFISLISVCFHAKFYTWLFFIIVWINVCIDFQINSASTLLF